MARKQSGWKTRGMNRDLSVSAYNSEFAFENRNLRLSTDDGNNNLSWVNEKGTASLTLSQPLTGTPIGTAVLNSYLIVFTTGSQDHIYRLRYSNAAKTSMKVTSLYAGYLGLSAGHPIETLVSYESEAIQKVYWVDGINQPRMINITRTYTATSGRSDENPDFIFDFVPELSLGETVKVRKELGATGTFAPGVIQYALTYYNKYGQESNIFYTSPLQYISHKDRGASPEDRVNNAFRITITNPDTRFDFLRIYSIQRTSINGTPICKRLQDISLEAVENNMVSYLDTGQSGSSIDPTELLFKGGEAITAGTIDQKDNTLFLGDITLLRSGLEQSLRNTIKSNVRVGCSSRRTIYPIEVSPGNYRYSSQLTAYGDSGKTYTVPCGGFKYGDTYRCGVQFQHKTGRWSDPVFIDDVPISVRPQYSSTGVGIPEMYGEIPQSVSSSLRALGYRRARGVVVFPTIQDRNVICQGVVNPTMYTTRHRSTDKDLYAQASWFFRPHFTGSYENTNGSVCPRATGMLEYMYQIADPATIKQVEIQGNFNGDLGSVDADKFQIDRSTLTLHSPDIEFDTQLSVLDYTGLEFRQVGQAQFKHTLSDIDIQTETPTISGSGGGFIHKSFNEDGAYGIVSGLFYDDYIVDDLKEGDDPVRIERFSTERSPVKWMVYLWNKTGSLNNDINRPADKGIASAVLRKKVISNLRYADTDISGSYSPGSFTEDPQLFSSNEPTIVKLGGSHIYRGNIDTVLNPRSYDGMYFAFGGDPNDNVDKRNVTTDFTHAINFKTYTHVDDTDTEQYGLYEFNNGWNWTTIGGPGNEYMDLAVKKDLVRMKYKSTPHLVFETGSSLTWANNCLPVVEVVRSTATTQFGGDSIDALKENVWIPCGEPVSLRSSGDTTYYYEYGDTYYQRYDCLKTYAYTPEDENQVVEIGSFMLESRVNIDGRYDRNRGQLSNLYMSPQNFNLINPVYSQQDNFFTYRIQDDDFYSNNRFPNQLTWTLAKTSGADTDLWTGITLASTLELDGECGRLTALRRLNNQLLAFQDNGISQILYNDNVQVSSTDGVPIEIANSGKVQGKNYFSNTVGCSNKWSMVQTPSSIYFMSSHDRSIYAFNGQLSNLSLQGGMNTWAKENIADSVWTPSDFEGFMACYDRLSQDVMFIGSGDTLAYSERLGAFTSFYSYEGTPYFCNLDGTGVWIRSDCSLWKHHVGEYCSFFGTQKPYGMTLIGNPEPQTDKIFTNLEFRACVDGDGSDATGRYVPYLPFDSLEVWNEYQHGSTALQHKWGHSAMMHHSGSTSSLKRKFRIWRCDIPRDSTHRIDRMRNPWLYLKLQKVSDTDRRTEIHDLIMTYFV